MRLHQNINIFFVKIIEQSHHLRRNFDLMVFKRLRFITIHYSFQIWSKLLTFVQSLVKKTWSMVETWTFKDFTEEENMFGVSGTILNKKQTHFHPKSEWFDWISKKNCHCKTYFTAKTRVEHLIFNKLRFLHQFSSANGHFFQNLRAKIHVQLAYSITYHLKSRENVQISKLFTEKLFEIFIIFGNES